tara:strand:+ start:1184 stop:1408 length:225 start_codon:yes stop_codon:yes gene_type:complete
MNVWILPIFCFGLIITCIVGLGILLIRREAVTQELLRREMLSDLKRLEPDFIAEQKVRPIIIWPGERSKPSEQP